MPSIYLLSSRSAWDARARNEPGSASTFGSEGEPGLKPPVRTGIEGSTACTPLEAEITSLAQRAGSTGASQKVRKLGSFQTSTAARWLPKRRTIPSTKPRQAASLEAAGGVEQRGAYWQ